MSEDGGGLGFCGYMLWFLSLLVIIVTLPFSLCLSIKVGRHGRLIFDIGVVILLYEPILMLWSQSKLPLYDYNNLQNTSEFRNRLVTGFLSSFLTWSLIVWVPLYLKCRLMPSWKWYVPSWCFLLTGQLPLGAKTILH